MNSPVAQDSAGQSPSQILDSSLFQRSEEAMFENLSGSPWLAREIERIPQNDLCDLHSSPVEERSMGEDLVRQKTASTEHDSAIAKHLVKKAALEEKLKVWQLDSAVSDSIVDSDGCGGSPYQSGLAIEKRILELEEASKRQDLAIQKHNVKKAALERGIKRHLDYEPGQPSKKPVFEAEQEVDVAVPVVPQNAEEVYRNETFDASRAQSDASRAYSEASWAQSDASWDQVQWDFSPLELIGGEFDERMLEEATPHQGRESANNITLRSRASMYEVSASQFIESNNEKRCGHRATSGNTVQEPKQQTPIKETIEQRDIQPDLEYASGGAASGGRSFTNWRLRRRPSSFGSVMDGMLKKFERVAIGAWPARKARHKRAVPVDDSVKT